MTLKKREQIKNLILEFEEKQKFKIKNEVSKLEIKNENCGKKTVRSLSQTSISNDSIDNNNCMEVNSNSSSSNSCNKKYKTDNSANGNSVTNYPVKGTDDIIQDINKL